MIQDIYPSRLDNSFRNCTMNEDDFLLVFDHEGRLLTGEQDGNIRFTSGCNIESDAAVYLFSVDDRRYFLASDKAGYTVQGFEYRTIRELRDSYSGKELFVAFTAYHLNKWYADNRFCGRCGEVLSFGEKERSLVCPKCGNTVYPRINPAVIVGVIKDDCLLITRYRRGYAHNALVAGFTEIGETLEETVKREVMEETGVSVTNIRYYRSQPWGMAQDILVGFYCDAVGDGDIRMDENELKYAEWVKRGDIILQPGSASLTNEMMRAFRDNEI